MPISFGGYLDDAIEEQTKMAQGYTGQANTFRSELDAVDNMAEGSYSRVLGGGALSALAAVIAGGDMTDAAAGFYRSGASAFNNLEAQEKVKRADLEKNIAIQETLARDSLNFGQQLTGYGIQNENQIGMQTLLGNVVGTPEYETAMTDKIDLINATESARNNAALELERQKKSEGLGLYGRGGEVASEEEINAAKALAKSIGVPDDQLSLLDNVPSKDLPKRVQELRLGKKEGIMQEGGYAKSISDNSLTAIEGAAKTADAVAPVMTRLKQYSDKLGQSTGGRFMINSIEREIPGTEGQVLQQELNNLAYQVVVAAQGRGASDAETKLLTDYLAGRTALAVGELDDRISRIARANAVAARTRLESLKTDPKYATQASKLDEIYGRSLPSIDQITSNTASVLAPSSGIPTTTDGDAAARARLEALRKKYNR